jgi:hypothetical protein
VAQSDETTQPLNSRARAAREAYLNALPPAEQAAVVRQAERIGVRVDDPDWLIARSAQEAGSEFKRATEVFDARLAAFERRLEQETRAPALPPDLVGLPVVVAFMLGACFMLTLVVLGNLFGSRAPAGAWWGIVPFLGGAALPVTYEALVSYLARRV